MTDLRYRHNISADRPANARRADPLQRAILQRAVQREPDNARAWLALAATATDLTEERACLTQVLRITPRDRVAIRRLRQIDAALAQLPTPFSSPPMTALPSAEIPRSGTFRRQFGIWLLIAALVIVIGGFVAQLWVVTGNAAPGATVTATPAFTLTVLPTVSPTPTATSTSSVPERVSAWLPDLERAWEARDWQSAIELLTEIRLLDPDYPGLQTAICDTYRVWSADLVESQDVAQAYDVLRRALGACQDDGLVIAKRLALGYLAGEWRYERGQWNSAGRAYQAVYDIDPTYARTEERLVESYVTWARSASERGDYKAALAACEAALSIRPDDPQALELAATVRRAIPTPTPARPANNGKRIEVNISQQRMYVWEGDRLLYNWVCSTGEPGRNTASGRYHVLDKIPEAWASTWSLRMPYWLGIYWTGSLENGIHALPILPNGQMLWAGYLGTPVSYGCIILSTENARTLYNWAEVGTPVWIHY